MLNWLDMSLLVYSRRKGKKNKLNGQGKEEKKRTPTGMCHLEESTYRLKVVKLLICILTTLFVYAKDKFFKK